MKRILTFIKGENGFYLPFVLVVSIVTLSATTTSIFIYQNEMEATNLLLQQLEVETTRQVVIEKFKEEEMYLKEDSGKFEYELPYSNTTGNYQTKNEEVEIDLKIKTDHLTYDFIYQLLLDERK